MTIPIAGERRSGKAAVIVARDTLSPVTSKLYKPFVLFVTFRALRGPLPFSLDFQVLLRPVIPCIGSRTFQQAELCRVHSPSLQPIFSLFCV
jgi:hypothetical protein